MRPSADRFRCTMPVSCCRLWRDLLKRRLDRLDVALGDPLPVERFELLNHGFPGDLLLLDGDVGLGRLLEPDHLPDSAASFVRALDLHLARAAAGWEIGRASCRER